jgi:hypothetical protein
MPKDFEKKTAKEKGVDFMKVGVDDMAKDHAFLYWVSMGTGCPKINASLPRQREFSLTGQTVKTEGL